MSGPAPAGRLGARIATLLRNGTLVAVAAIGTGFVIALVSDDRGTGARPVTEVIGAGGPDGIIAAGLLGFTLLPLGVLAVAALTFGAQRERRYLIASVATLVLLAASLVVAAVFARAG
jgi:uncharacterized membrane protein